MVSATADSASATANVLDGPNNQAAALTDTGTLEFQASNDPCGGTGGVTIGRSSSFWRRTWTTSASATAWAPARPG